MDSERIKDQRTEEHGGRTKQDFRSGDTRTEKVAREAQENAYPCTAITYLEWAET